MTKTYSIIHLNGFLYMVDKEGERNKYTTDFITDGEQVRLANNQTELDSPMWLRIVGTNDPSLGLPLLPEINALLVADEEIWLPVLDYESYYEVSNKGRVKSLSRNVNGYRVEEKILKPGIHTYITVTLAKEGIKQTKRVHDLMNKAFFGDTPFIINHLDENRLNNDGKNLQLTTQAWNVIYSINKKATSSKFSGVYLNKGIWMARLTINGKRTFLGTFKTEKEANQAIIDFKAKNLIEYIPLPKFIEVEMESYTNQISRYNYIPKDDDFLLKERPKVDENNYINVLKWIYA